MVKKYRIKRLWNGGLIHSEDIIELEPLEQEEKIEVSKEVLEKILIHSKITIDTVAKEKYQRKYYSPLASAIKELRNEMGVAKVKNLTEKVIYKDCPASEPLEQEEKKPRKVRATSNSSISREDARNAAKKDCPASECDGSPCTCNGKEDDD